MVSAGCTVSPPIVFICIRAGWIMGGVKHKYLKYKAAGDLYVGRYAASLDQLRNKFSVSPPHFGCSAVEGELEKVQLEDKVHTWITSRRNIRTNTPIRLRF